MKNQNRGSASQKALRAMFYLMCGGIISIILFSTPIHGFLNFLRTGSVGMLVAGASALVGGLLGFLFGIPRTLQKEEESVQAEDGSKTSINKYGQKVSYQANTNLEQISDWLTKILVGVGLTQLTTMPEKFLSLSNFVAQGLDGALNPSVLAGAILIFFGVCGFLFGYLWTRLNFVAALKEADLGALFEKVEKTGKKLNELENQATRDALALSLVQRQLNPRSDSPNVDENQLKEAIIKSSPAVKTTIFYQAWDIRSKNWRDYETKVIMERTIPIFQALKDSDIKDEYHMNHGQLGFALKDKREPDWVNAEAELTKAIKIRGSWKEKGWLFYEFGRAICRIMLEPTLKDKNSVEMSKQGILSDLKVASHGLMNLVESDPVIMNWLKKQKIGLKDIER